MYYRRTSRFTPPRRSPAVRNEARPRLFSAITRSTPLSELQDERVLYVQTSTTELAFFIGNSPPPLLDTFLDLGPLPGSTPRNRPSPPFPLHWMRVRSSVATIFSLGASSVDSSCSLPISARRGPDLDEVVASYRAGRVGAADLKGVLEEAFGAQQVYTISLRRTRQGMMRSIFLASKM